MQKKKNLSESTTALHIRNMVCNRCVRVVSEELARLGHSVQRIGLGEAVISGPLNDQAREAIRKVLEKNGFELIEDRRLKTIERIKHLIISLVQRDAEKDPLRVKLSEYLSTQLGMDYHSLSTLFSSVENVTIERYLILQRIERAKELLKYNDMTLSGISYKLGYSSVQHLSAQFKAVTGMTPSEFKGMVRNMRRPIDRVV
jgi:AraC-like DNA-binding protein